MLRKGKPMSELIDRQAAIDALESIGSLDTEADKKYARSVFEALPSVQPEPLTLRVNNELTKEEYDKLMQDIKDAPVVLLPSAQPDRKPSEWLHDLLQTAIDDGIITEVQAVRIMERVSK